jgi:hypothetical protein
MTSIEEDDRAVAMLEALGGAVLSEIEKAKAGQELFETIEWLFMIVRDEVSDNGVERATETAIEYVENNS